MYYRSQRTEFAHFEMDRIMLDYMKIASFSTLTFLLLGCGGGASQESAVQADLTPPSITLHGESKIEMLQNKNYKELGAKATDREDGEVSVLVSGDVLTHIPGEYEVKYSATDTAGNIASSYRTIKVLKTDESATDAHPSYLNQHKVSVLPKKIKEIEVHVVSSMVQPQYPDTYIRANDITLSTNNNAIMLNNHSYQKIKSLIGKYTDDNNHTQLVKLSFDTTLNPNTNYTLQHFTHADTMQIFHTAEMFDQAVTYNGNACDENKDDTHSVKYCMPSQEEQTAYSRAIANLHRFYNSMDALPSFISWSEQKPYRDLDFYGYPQGFTVFKEKSLIQSFLKATLPNNALTLKTTQYLKNQDGVGAGDNISLVGSKESLGWASLWHENISFEHDKEVSEEDTYALLHHEMMHARGFTHSSGMTYGFSNAVGTIIENLYPSDILPALEVPKYVFDVSHKADNQMLLTVYHTSTSNEEDLMVEVLSAHPVAMQTLAATEDNQIIVLMQDAPSIRFYLRLYAEDSTQVMSKLVYPYAFVPQNIENSKYHIIPYANWQYVSEHNDEQLQMRPKDAERLCKAWTGSYDAKTEVFRKVEALEGIESSLLVHSAHSYQKYYLHSSTQSTEIAYDATVNDPTASVLCTTN